MTRKSRRFLDVVARMFKYDSYYVGEARELIRRLNNPALPEPSPELFAYYFCELTSYCVFHLTEDEVLPDELIPLVTEHREFMAYDRALRGELAEWAFRKMDKKSQAENARRNDYCRREEYRLNYERKEFDQRANRQYLDFVKKRLKEESDDA